MKSPSRNHDPILIQWLMLAIGVLVLASAAAFELYQSRERIEKREQDRLLSVTSVVQINFERNLESVNQVLSDLREELSSGTPTGNLNQRLLTLAEAMPSIRTLNVHDIAGTIRASSRPEIIGFNKDYAQRDYFRIPQQNPSKETLFVSPPFLTTSGTYSIVVTRMISDARGGFAGVITATFDPKYFGPLLDSVRYEQDVAASLHHGDGVVFMASPREREQVIGKNLAKPGSFFTRHRESGATTSVFSGTMLSTGEERMVAQRDIRPAALKMDKSIGIAVSRLLTKVYAQWRDDVLKIFGLFVGTVLTFSLALYFYQKQYRLARRNEEEAAEALRSSEWKLKSIIEAEPECVKVLSPDGALRQMNRAGLDMIEADSEEQVIGTKMVDIVARQHRAAFRALTQRVNQGEAGSLEFEIVGLKGGHRWLDTHAVPMRDADGKITGLLGVTRDVTEQKQTAERMRESEARYRLLAENIHDVIWTLDIQSQRFTYISPSVKNLRGYTPEEIMAQPTAAAMTPESAVRVTEALQQMLEKIAAGERNKLSTITRVDQPHRDGHIVPTEVVTTYLLDNHGFPLSIVGVSRDITERVKIEQELEHMAHTDSLTGLANRRHFMALAEQEISRANRYGGPLSVFMMDLDLFKNINDTYGHQTGDIVLKRLGDLLREALRDIDSVGRVGGEEFAVVLPHTDSARALEVAERLRQTAERAEVALAHGMPLRFTLSIGVTTLVDATTNIDTLISQADNALYEAKRLGRNRVEVYSGQTKRV